MRVSELISQLREFEPETVVQMQLGSRGFASPGWVGIMDTAGLFDEEKNFQLVIAPWEPADDLKAGSDLGTGAARKLQAREAAQACGNGWNHAQAAAHSQLHAAQKVKE